MGNCDEVSFATQYLISADEYIDIPVTSLPFSVRVINRFSTNNVISIADLLKLTPKSLMAIKGFGANCLNEVHEYVSALQSNEAALSCLNYSANSNPSNFIYEQREHIAVGDFSFADSEDLTQTEQELVQTYKGAYENIGEDLVLECICCPDKIHPISSMLNEFFIQSKYNSGLLPLLDSIPYFRKNNKCIGYINAYVLDEDKRNRLLSFLPDDDSLLRTILDKNIPKDVEGHLLLKRFLEWCKFDLNKEIESVFQKIYTRERTKTVVQLRAQRYTLEQIGTVLGVTRERVRQIELKARNTFAYWQSRTRVISKISADQNGDPVITPEEIESYCGTNVNELLFFLRGYESSSYTYDYQFDVFVVGNESLRERVLLYVENLPDIISTSNISEIIKAAQETEDLPEDMLKIAIADAYRLTGDVYHRTRLSLASVYTAILKEHYPYGMNAYDDNEIETFRGYVKSAYGNVKLPANNRAITARIASISVLYGRGRYILKKTKYMPDDLAGKIYSYIFESDKSIFLTNTLFSIFEDELVAAGIENKYYLQGVLHELYGEQLFFRRDYISKDKNFTSIYSSIGDYIKRFDYPIDKTTIFKEFPGVTDIVLNFATSEPNVLNFFGEYLHASKLIISETEKQYLKRVIDSALLDGAAHHIRDLHDRISHEMPEVLTRNAALYPFSTFSILEYLFRNEYQFSRPYIAWNSVEIGRPGEQLRDLMYNSGRDEFSISEISDFAKENHFQIQSLLEYANGYNDAFLLTNNNTLVSVERLSITEEIACIIEALICNELTGTSPICQLSCFHLFPDINIDWTDWLVYSTLNKWSTKLVVGVSSSQLRMATPLVARVGQMDATPFWDIRQVDMSPAITVDNLDNIDDLLADIIDEVVLKEGL